MNQSVINNLAAKINSKEQKSNKVTSLSSSSTNVEYPSAKAVYDTITDERIYNVKKEFTGQIENTFYYKYTIDDYDNYDDYSYPELPGEAELSINITTPLANGEGFLINGLDSTYSFISNGTNIIFSNMFEEYEINPSFTIPNTNIILNFKVIPDETYPEIRVILFTCISNNSIIGQYTIDDYDNESDILWYHGINTSLAGTYKYTLDFYNKYELKTSTGIDYYDYSEVYRKSGTYIEYDITFNEDGDTFVSDGSNENSPSFTYDDGKIIANAYNDTFDENTTYELKTGNSCKIIEYVIGNNKKYLFDNAILCTIPYEEDHIHINWKVTNNEESEPDTEVIATIYQPIKTRYISELDNDSDFISKSNTSGLVKNDGTIDTNTYLSNLPTHNHTISQVTDTNNYVNFAPPIQTQGGVNAGIDIALGNKADKTTTLDTTNLSAYVENKFLILTDEEEEEMITIGCAIIWDDQNNSSKVRPLSVKCTLSDGSEYILSNINDWSITIQVPKYDASNEEIQYSWSIAEVNGYRLINTTVNNNITTFTLYKLNFI